MIGISTACFYPMVTEKSFEIVAQLGFPCVEVFLNTAQEYDEQYLKQLKRRADESAVRIPAIHPFTCPMEPMLFFSEYERRFQDGVDYYKNYFEAAAYLGAGIVVFHGDTLAGPCENSFYFDRFFRLARAAKEFGIILAQENVCRCKSGKISFIRQMKEALGNEVRFVLDVKQAVRSGEDVFETASAMGENIVHVHCSDHRKGETCLLPGFGDFGFEKLMKQVCQNNYKIDYIIEVYRENFKNREELIKSKQHLDNINQKIV